MGGKGKGELVRWQTIIRIVKVIMIMPKIVAKITTEMIIAIRHKSDTPSRKRSREAKNLRTVEGKKTRAERRKRGKRDGRMTLGQKEGRTKGRKMANIQRRNQAK